MAESFLTLPRADRAEALETAAAGSGRPAYLLEKDCWVVWALQVLFESKAGEHLVFKGGTSLSKVYGAINRFSEDVDLTCNIRTLLGEGIGSELPDPIPSTRSQASTWSNRVAERLPGWLDQEIMPVLVGVVTSTGLPAKVALASGGIVNVTYEPAVRGETSYVAPVVRLEFGARSTGEPASVHRVDTDAAAHVTGLEFPVAHPRVMAIERTFWEKATLAHVICSGGPWRGGDRLSRHWSDLAALDDHASVDGALKDRELAEAVARHKASFFRETDQDGQVIDYAAAVRGSLRLVPGGDRLGELEGDYRRMTEAGLLPEEAPSFKDVIATSASLAERANAWSR